MMMIFFKYKKRRLWMRITLAGSLCELLISPCLVPVKRSFQLAMNFCIEMNWKYLPNAPNLGHIPCLDWTWVHLMLRPLGNMKEDHGPRSLVPAKYFSFSSLLETNYQENIFGQCPWCGHACQKNGLVPQMKTWFHARRTYLHTI